MVVWEKSARQRVIPVKSQRDMMSVLVIDDEHGVSRLIRFNLEDDSTQVIDASTGLDGIRILKEENIDLLLLDTSLPDIDARTILNQVRRSDSQKKLHVIVISAEPPDRLLIEQFKVDDYIQKPFDMRDLLVRINNVINLRYAS